MNTRQIIRTLSQRNGLIVSLYLPVLPSQTRRDLATIFHSHLKDLLHTAKNLKHSHEKYLDAILEKIDTWLSKADTRNAKTLVVFAGKDIFKTLKLPVSLKTRVHIANKPLLAPLTEAIEENPSFLLVLLDRDKAKLIEVNFSSEEAESKLIESDVPKRILARGDNMGRESKILRHIEDHLHRHLFKVVEEVKSFEKNYPDGLLVIGSQKELVGKFTRLLTTPLKKRVIGDFGANVDDNEAQVISKAQTVVDQYLEKVAWKQI